MIEINRHDSLFDFKLPILLTTLTPVQDQKYVDLTVRILNGTRTNAPGHTERLLHFEVTDDDDLYFLYVLDVGEHDFHNLKREQSLLVDFSVFPAKLIELLEHCVNVNKPSTSSSNNNISSQQNEVFSPNFLAKLDASSGLLSIVECNLFKQLMHISLQLRPGNDAAIKSYLASRLEYSTDLSRRLSQELDHTKDTLQEEQSITKNLLEECQRLRSGRELEIQNLKVISSQEISELRLKSLQEQSEIRRVAEEALQQLRVESDQNIGLARQRGDDLEHQLNALQQERSESDQRERNLTREYTASIAEVNRLQLELKREKESKEVAESQCHKSLLRIHELDATITTLERQVANKEETIIRLSAQNKDYEQSAAQSSAKIAQLQNSLSALQEQLRGAAMEIERGNQAMSLLQEQCGRLRDKVQLKSDVIRRQEALVEELRQRVTESEQRVAAAESSSSLSSQKEASSKAELSAAKLRLADAESLIESNQKVISWLNQEITRLQLAGASSWSNNNTYGVDQIDLSLPLSLSFNPSLPPPPATNTTSNMNGHHDYLRDDTKKEYQNSTAFESTTNPYNSHEHQKTIKPHKNNNASIGLSSSTNNNIKTNNNIVTENFDSKKITTTISNYGMFLSSDESNKIPSVIKYDWQRPDFGLDSLPVHQSSNTNK